MVFFLLQDRERITILRSRSGSKRASHYKVHKISSRFPIPDSRFPIPYSLLPTPYSEAPHNQFPSKIKADQ
ncbi:MAG: hypothetical protein F6K50_25605 [Moorea sp. SIO3I7]|uniref:hypothetical protein n=1 Tax=Moorena sp. SIO3I8 TaxID=2607833 RepID=UPI0013C1CF41|nr:hypothetical protein [Moorena sp. SIO3I8]NEN98757.1 hypothetical protein [Moorena sp. SIO3I7]NEO06772.1 hypothetical protein [Moorena sp. SIO3I8]